MAHQILTTVKKHAVARHDYFEFYHSAGGGGGCELDLAIAPTGANSAVTDFELEYLLIHWSTACPSIVYLRVWVSSVLGSAYNANLFSLALSGVKDVMWGPEVPLKLLPGDQVLISGTVSGGASAGNYMGLRACGWTIIG